MLETAFRKESFYKYVSEVIFELSKVYSSSTALLLRADYHQTQQVKQTELSCAELHFAHFIIEENQHESPVPSEP